MSSVDFVEDVRLSDTILTASERSLRKFRNTLFKYALGNLNDFDPETDAVPADKCWKSISGFF